MTNDETNTASPLRGGGRSGNAAWPRGFPAPWAGSIGLVLRVISPVPRAGTITIHGHGPGGGSNLGKSPWQKGGLARFLDFRSLGDFGSLRQRPGAEPRLPLTPIKPSAPLSQDH